MAPYRWTGVGAGVVAAVMAVDAVPGPGPGTNRAGR